MGEGGPLPRGNFRTLPIEFDRRGRFDDMRPRWQSDAYGSRNPVALMIGTEGWGLFIATPWGQVDLRDANRGVFSPWQPPAPDCARGEGEQNEQKRGKQAERTSRPSFRAGRRSRASCPAPTTCSSSTPTSRPSS